jgi:transglutaminase-like putative cysteine protease
MKLEIDHHTTYRYSAPVRSSTQILRLTPQNGAGQQVLHWKLDTTGGATRTRDGYGNVLHVLTLDSAVQEIHIHSRGRIQTAAGDDAAVDAVVTGGLSPLVFLRPTPLTRTRPAMVEFAEAWRRRAASLSGLREMAAALNKRMPALAVDEVDSEQSEVSQAPASVPASAQVHAFIACLRHLGIPARYVSGYVYSPAASVGGEQAAGAATWHAWAEAWVVDRWRSFDVMARCAAGEQHVRVAIGADELDACPIRGVRTGGGLETLVSSIQLTPITT